MKVKEIDLKELDRALMGTIWRNYEGFEINGNVITIKIDFNRSGDFRFVDFYEHLGVTDFGELAVFSEELYQKCYLNFLENYSENVSENLKTFIKELEGLEIQFDFNPKFPVDYQDFLKFHGVEEEYNACVDGNCEHLIV